MLGVIELKDIVKGGIKERFEQLCRMGIRAVMITGDNRLTAAAIAAEAGVDRALTDEFAQGRQFGFLGELRVNVPRLNLQLDAITRR